MNESVVLAKNVTVLLVDSLLFIPKGVVYPFASLLDYLKTVFKKHRTPACVHCPNPVQTLREYRQGLDKGFDYLSGWIEPIIFTLVSFTIWLFSRIISKAFLLKLTKISEQLHQRLKNAEQKRSEMVWKYTFPLMLFGVGVYVWGLIIIPEIYLFIIASVWSGKVINALANLIARNKHSNEWKCLKSLWGRTFLNEHRQDVIDLSKDALRDIFIVGLLRRYSDFFKYASQAFLGWLALYIAVKKVTDNTPQILDRLEKYMAKHPEPSVSHDVAVASWLVFYHSLEQMGSEHSLQEYRQKHEAVQHKATQRPH